MSGRSPLPSSSPPSPRADTVASGGSGHPTPSRVSRDEPLLAKRVGIMTSVTIVGGGLAGSEAAWQLAERGHDVVVHEMRPVVKTAAHQTESLAELVCSNTFKSTDTSNAHGLLKAEMRAL